MSKRDGDVQKEEVFLIRSWHNHTAKLDRPIKHFLGWLVQVLRFISPPLKTCKTFALQPWLWFEGDWVCAGSGFILSTGLPLLSSLSNPPCILLSPPIQHHVLQAEKRPLLVLDKVHSEPGRLFLEGSCAKKNFKCLSCHAVGHFVTVRRRTIVNEARGKRGWWWCSDAKNVNMRVDLGVPGGRTLPDNHPTLLLVDSYSMLKLSLFTHWDFLMSHITGSLGY